MTLPVQTPQQISQQQINYVTTFQIKKGFMYNEATTIIRGLSKSCESEGDIFLYGLDDAKTEVVLTDVKKGAIKLSDKVKFDVEMKIKHLLEERQR